MWYSESDMSIPDSQLLEEIAKGSSKAFDLVFRKYYNNLCRYAFLVIHDADMAQSLVQNVFVKLWEKRLGLGRIGNLASYLTAMVRNQCFDYLKEQKILDSDLKLKNSDSHENSTEDTILGNEFEECLIEALSKLPPRCRIAFELSRFDNKTNKEIAQEMKISVKGVEALIGRSLKSLRLELREFLPSFDLKDIMPILYFLRFSKNIFSENKIECV